MSARKSGTEEVLDFEKAMAELEETVRRLEAGDSPLEESLTAFEKGVKLVRRLHARLDAVQSRIEELTQAPPAGDATAARPGADGGADDEG